MSLNINGDLPDEEIIKRALLAEKAGINVVWIGELELFKDPFHVVEIIAENTSLSIGFGTLSPLRRNCKDILNRVNSLVSKYDNPFLLGISAGNFSDPKKAVDAVMKCVETAKKELKIPVFVGCSSPKITRYASKIADGILFNYVHPTYLQWIMKHMEKDTFTAAYGPSLILPSPYYQDLLLAAAIVMGSSKAFLREFKLENAHKELTSVDFASLIKARQSGADLEKLPEFRILEKHSILLMERFTISGSVDSVREKIQTILRICDHVVLGDPYFRDAKAVKMLKDVVPKIRTNLNQKQN